jgi:hypothetical protein
MASPDNRDSIRISQFENGHEKTRAHSLALEANVNANEHEVPVRRCRMQRLETGESGEESSGGSRIERPDDELAQHGGGGPGARGRVGRFPDGDPLHSVTGCYRVDVTEGQRGLNDVGEEHPVCNGAAGPLAQVVGQDRIMMEGPGKNPDRATRKARWQHPDLGVHLRTVPQAVLRNLAQ